jgi:hypothetical protein
MLLLITASITHNVPVLPIPALQCTRNISRPELPVPSCRLSRDIRALSTVCTQSFDSGTPKSGQVSSARSQHINEWQSQRRANTDHNVAPDTQSKRLAAQKLRNEQILGACVAISNRANSIRIIDLRSLHRLQVFAHFLVFEQVGPTVSYCPLWKPILCFSPKISNLNFIQEG